ncbi:MAG: ferredoxin family protein [Deltaproteobacteria bacterium]|nr:ferredoxin family protein [Deltaproteobacteria bacterium]
MEKKVVINRAWCKGCGICQAFCPKHVLELDKQEKMTVARPEDCNLCGLCEQRCPDLAIELVEQEPGQAAAST